MARLIRDCQKYIPLSQIACLSNTAQINILFLLTSFIHNVALQQVPGKDPELVLIDSQDNDEEVSTFMRIIQ